MNNQNQFSINSLIANRKSLRAFSNANVDDIIMKKLFEAARWAPSSYNDQPWRFIYAYKDAPAFHQLLQTAVEFNQQWAKNASALMVSVAKMSFDHNGQPNAHAWHDVGMAMQNLAIQATELGVMIHQMAGFDAQKAKKIFNIPDGYEIVALVAIGYPGPKESLPESLRKMEDAPRTRKPIEEIAFEGAWK
jgi:nitroreductase